MSTETPEDKPVVAKPKGRAAKPKRAEDGVVKPPMTPRDMLAHAVESGASVEIIGKLIELDKYEQERQAGKAFDAAVSAARKDLPATIRKNQKVKFGHTEYDYEDFKDQPKTYGLRRLTTIFIDPLNPSYLTAS